jgi:hypothetical protein
MARSMKDHETERLVFIDLSPVAIFPHNSLSGSPSSIGRSQSSRPRAVRTHKEEMSSFTLLVNIECRLLALENGKLRAGHRLIRYHRIVFFADREKANAAQRRQDLTDVVSSRQFGGKSRSDLSKTATLPHRFDVTLNYLRAESINGMEKVRM